MVPLEDLMCLALDGLRAQFRDPDTETALGLLACLTVADGIHGDFAGRFSYRISLGVSGRALCFKTGGCTTNQMINT